MTEVTGVLPGDDAQGFRQRGGGLVGGKESYAAQAATRFVIAQCPAITGEEIVYLARQHDDVLT